MPSPDLEPKEYVLCAHCDGAMTVEVNSYTDVDGKPHDVSDRYIECPRCDATGFEPEPSEYDDPRIP